MAALALIPLAACEFDFVRIALPDGNKTPVDGFKVWYRPLDRPDLPFEELYRIDFDGPLAERDSVTYQVLQDKLYITLEAKIERSPYLPDTVVLDPVYLPVRSGGEFRVSVFNAAGDSGLSSQSIIR